MTQSKSDSLDWSDKRAVLRWIAGELGRKHRPEIIRFLRKVPPGVKKLYWGGGARLPQMRPSQFARGLVNALRDPQISRAVGLTWCSYNRDTAHLLDAALSRWPLVHNTLSPDAWDFLTTRAQLPADVLIAHSVAQDHDVELQEAPPLLRAGERALYHRPEPQEPSSLLRTMRTRIDLLAVETLGARVHKAASEPLIRDGLAENDLDRIVGVLLEGNTPDRLAAAYYRILQGDADGAADLAKALLEEHGEDDSGAVAVSGLSMLALGRAAEALQRFEELPTASVSRLSPLHAALALAVDAPELAVRVLCSGEYGRCSLRAYPLRLCAAILKEADLEPPPLLNQVVDRGWVGSDQRRALHADLQAIVARSDQVCLYRDDSPCVEPAALGEDRSISGGIPAEDETTDDAIQPIIALATEFRAARKTLETATQAQRWSEVGRLASELQRIESEVASQVQRLGASSNSQQPRVRLTVPDAGIIASENSFADWLADARSRLHARSQEAARARESLRESLKRDLAGVGIEVPVDLLEADSVERLSELREEYASELTIRKAFQRAMSRGVASARLDQLPAEERLEVYRLLVEESPKPDLASQILSDRELTDSLGRPVAELLLILTRWLLSNGTPPPAGTISMMTSALKDPGETLAANGILEALQAVDVDTDELSQAFAGIEVSLPRGLRQRLEMHRVLQLSAADRLPRLLAALESTPSGEALQLAVFQTLAELGRHGEAVYLAGLLARMESYVLDDDGPREQVIRLLMSPALLTRPPDCVVAILNDWSWWLERDELVVTLLYLMRSYRLHDDIINFQFAEPAAWESASRRFPALVEHLVGHNVKVESAELADARKVLGELRRELERESCYSNWVNAVAYQAHFRSVLEAMLEGLANGEEVDLRRRPEEIIDERAVDGMPMATDAARRAMVRFLQDQLHRLQVLARVLPATPLDILDRDADAWRDALADEAAGLKPNSALAAVYRRCLEDGE